jgi:long-chain acyl-CoA synthetase
MGTPTRTFDLVQSALQNHPLPNALNSKINGAWVAISTEEFKDRIDKTSNGLIEIGVKPGDKIATITNNRPEWNIVNYAAAQIGAIICPIYPTISEAEYKYIFNDAQMKIAFVSSKDLLQKILSIKSEVPSLESIYTFDQIEGAEHWSEIENKGEGLPHDIQVTELKNKIDTKDLVTIIYTSGTTGKPKGVMLSHENLVSNCVEGTKLLPVEKGEKALSFLPLCHVFERTLLNVYIYAGISIYYAESLDTIGDNIKEVKPHIFTAVPRLIEKVYDKIIAGGSQKPFPLKQIFFWAVNRANNYSENYQRGFLDGFAEKLVYSKIKAGLGGNVKTIVSGSAALQPRLAKFFWGIGIPILEGYGLTETSPVVSVNTTLKDGLKFGSVGKLLNGVEVKMASDGEILVKGPNVMMGYYQQPDLTKQVLGDDGWFHTGDIGVFEGEFLKITDRKKEMFKTSGGKYVAPQPIENKMKESQFIEQIIVVGESQKHASALIVPAFQFVKEWLKEQGHDANLSNAELIKLKIVKEAIDKEVVKYNQNFGKVEQIKKIVLLDKEWTVEDGELTPTMKLKRKVIHERFKETIDGIYN